MLRLKTQKKNPWHSGTWWKLGTAVLKQYSRKCKSFIKGFIKKAFIKLYKNLDLWTEGKRFCTNQFFFCFLPQEYKTNHWFWSILIISQYHESFSFHYNIDLSTLVKPLLLFVIWRGSFCTKMGTDNLSVRQIQNHEAPFQSYQRQAIIYIVPISF